MLLKHLVDLFHNWLKQNLLVRYLATLLLVHKMLVTAWDRQIVRQFLNNAQSPVHLVFHQ